MIQAPDYYPLGSVVTLQGNDLKKLMIIGRALAVEHESSIEYYDYALVLYPEGLIGDSIVYSNHDCISKVFMRGFSDEEEPAFLEKLVEAVSNAEGIPRSHPEEKDVW